MDTRADERARAGLLTVEQACRFLEISKKKLYKLNHAGLVDMRKLGHTTLIPEASLRRYLADLPRREAKER